MSEQKTITVAQHFVESLEAEGVKYIFGIPGEETEDLLFALNQSVIQFVPTRHEQGAAFMANIWGRLTGKAGVCLSTLGPGATNLITGVADAFLDKAPTVAITGQGGFDRQHHESHQYIDAISLFRPVTKWNATVHAPDVVGEVIRQAFKIAESEKPGSAHVELSEDIAKKEMSTKAAPLKKWSVRRPAPDQQSVDEAVQMLRKAKRPLIIAGNGAIRKRSSQELTRLVEDFNLPVAATFMGKGAVSDAHEQSLFTIGVGFKDYVYEAIRESDLIMAVGYDIAEYPPEQWNPAGDKKIIHIDFHSTEAYTHYVPEVEIVADISASLKAIHRHLESSHERWNGEWFQSVRKRIVADIASYEANDASAPTIPGALHIIRNFLPDDGLLISDVGSHKLWIARNFPTYCPNGCIIGNGLASMGIALPGGIAASLESPGRCVVAAMGDGGALMNIQELETAKRLGVPLVIVVFNDNDYGLISWKQTMNRNQSVHTKIGNPNFAELARSFGIHGELATNLKEFSKALDGCTKLNAPCLIELQVDNRVNMELVHKLQAYWRNHS